MPSYTIAQIAYLNISPYSEATFMRLPWCGWEMGLRVGGKCGIIVGLEGLSGFRLFVGGSYAGQSRDMVV